MMPVRLRRRRIPGFTDPRRARKKPHPSLEGRNVQRLMLSSNPCGGEIKLEEIVDRTFVRKLDDSGFIDRAFAAAGVK